MDVLFTEEDELWRQEIREWIAKEIPPQYRIYDETFFQGDPEDQWRFRKQVSLKLAEKGWLTMAWPREYGGEDARPVKMAIYADEMGYWGAEPAFGTTRLGPPIMGHGTKEQKAKWLPLVASGKISCALGDSEPDAGSDTANIRTTAVLDGDHFILNGHKHFSTFGHRSEYTLLLAVTDPEGRKRHNLSRFIVDLNSPGVTRLPQYNMSGTGWPQCETFYDNVRIPKENLIGTLNNAWLEITTDQGGFQGSGKLGAIRRDFDEFVAFCKANERNGKPLIEDPLIGSRLAIMATELQAILTMYWQSVSEMEKNFGKPLSERGGRGLHSGGSIPALAQKEWLASFANSVIQIAGPLGSLQRGAKWAAKEGWNEQFYRRYAFDTHGHGTPELLRMIIATRGLGLPRY